MKKQIVILLTLSCFVLSSNIWANQPKLRRVNESLSPHGKRAAAADAKKAAKVATPSAKVAEQKPKSALTQKNQKPIKKKIRFSDATEVHTHEVDRITESTQKVREAEERSRAISRRNGTAPVYGNDKKAIQRAIENKARNSEITPDQAQKNAIQLHKELTQ